MSTTPTVTPSEQLGWEARVGRFAAGAAFLAAACAAASTAVQLSIGGAKPEDRSEALMRFDEHRGEYVLSLGFQILSYFLLAGALLYLLRATTYRRPETPKFSIGLVMLAPVLLAVGGVLSQIELGNVTDEFLAGGSTSNERAKDLLKDQSILGGAIGYGGILCQALSFVIVSLNAMRAGLLSRFMGVLGIIVGGLLILPLLPGGQSVVQVFWLVAVGVLFIDRWPGGRGPAWETGEAVPWPSAAELREGASEDPPAPERDEEPEPEAGAERASQRVSKKRKRKRR